MATYKKIVPTLPVVDLVRANKFYQEKLGCRITRQDPGPGAQLDCHGSELYLYQRPPSNADHTLASLQVENTEKAVAELRQKGVKFEEYNMPEMGIKTVNGIAEMGGMKGAWFKDSEGNILSIIETTPSGHPGRHEKREEVVSPW